jgi:nucleosome binding factor SPN SPT16 subunit
VCIEEERQFQFIFSQQRIGTLPKEEQVGKTVTQYKAALDKAGHSFESVDIATALGAVMAIKDDDELVSILEQEQDSY